MAQVVGSLIFTWIKFPTQGNLGPLCTFEDSASRWELFDSLSKYINNFKITTFQIIMVMFGLGKNYQWILH